MNDVRHTAIYSFLIVLVSLAFSFAGTQGVVKVIPAPDYPYGLTYDGTYLWVGTSYANSGGDYLWKIDPSDGSVAGTIPVPDPNGFYTVKGLAFDGQYLWVFEDLPTASHPDKFYKVDPSTGAVLKTVNSPFNNYIGGITYGNGYLWYSNYYGTTPEGMLFQMDTTGALTSNTIVSVGEQPMGMAFDGQYIWCAEDTGFGASRQEIYKYDPVTLTYTGDFIRGPDESPRDMTWDGQYLWMIGYHSTNSVIYQISLSGGTPEIYLPVTSLDFGLVSIGDTSSYTFQIMNQGTAPLEISAIDFSTTVYFTEPLSYPLQVPAGGSVAFDVSFAPTAIGQYPADMTIHSNDPATPTAQVSLSGQGQYVNPTIWLSANSHDFGNVWVPIEGKAKWILKIANTGNQNLEIVDLILNKPEFSVGGFDGLPITIAPNDTFPLLVYFQPSDTLTYSDSLIVASTDPAAPYAPVYLTGKGILDDYTSGYTFWQYYVPDNPDAGSYQEYEVDGLKSMNDINGDGVGEVVIATENYWLLCLDGNSSGNADTLWSFSTYISNYSAGSIGANSDYGVQDAIAIASDLNGDSYNDVVIATGGGNEHVYAINGTNGQILWQFGTDDPGSYSLGDFEAVDAKRDFNNDGVPDVLAIADGNDQGTGYHSAYLFDGSNGSQIWTYQYPGPNLSFGKTVISIDDVTGDGVPDAVIAVGNNGSTDLKTYCIDGDFGTPLWDHDAVANEPKELVELPVTNETPDVIVGEYFSTVQRLDGETGVAMWTRTLGGLAGIIQMDVINDVDNDGVMDVLIASFASGATCLSGATGDYIWSYPMAFQYGISSVPDLNGDGYDDVIVASGTNNPDAGVFYCISGKGDSLLFSHSVSGDRVHTVYTLPSIDGNSTYELLAGTKYGHVFCFSGGLEPVAIDRKDASLTQRFALAQNYPNPFNPETVIGFDVPSRTEINLRVFNILGQEVAALIDHKMVEAGNHQVTFDASKLPSGVYIYRLESKYGVLSHKMILMK